MKFVEVAWVSVAVCHGRCGTGGVIGKSAGYNVASCGSVEWLATVKARDGIAFEAGWYCQRSCNADVTGCTWGRGTVDGKIVCVCEFGGMYDRRGS